jgi:hypothetical protein
MITDLFYTVFKYSTKNDDHRLLARDVKHIYDEMFDHKSLITEYPNLEKINKNQLLHIMKCSGIDFYDTYQLVKPCGDRYYAHDNGGRPFEVIVNGDVVSVYKGKNYDKDWDEYSDSESDDEVAVPNGYYIKRGNQFHQINTDSYYKKTVKDPYHVLIKTFKSYEKVFIGKYKHPDLHPNHQNNRDGNSVLIKLGTNDDKYEYVYIGSEIFNFTTEDEILEYHSPIGNSDVPYPYAVGAKNTYLMLDQRCILNSDLPEFDHVGTNVYTIYYGQDAFEDFDLESTEMNIKIIQKRVI